MRLARICSTVVRVAFAIIPDFKLGRLSTVQETTGALAHAHSVAPAMARSRLDMRVMAWFDALVILRPRL